MTTRPPLTLAGADVALSARLPDGRVLVAFLDREGVPTGYRRPCRAHELRGIGWHLAEIKARIARLPMHGAGDPIPSPEAATPRRGFLHAHHTAAED